MKLEGEGGKEREMKDEAGRLQYKREREDKVGRLLLYQREEEERGREINFLQPVSKILIHTTSSHCIPFILVCGLYCTRSVMQQPVSSNLFFFWGGG